MDTVVGSQRRLGRDVRDPTGRTPADELPATAEEPQPELRVRRWWLALIVASLSPFLIGVISRIQNMGTGEVVGDRALIALSVRAVWSHPVLLGAYSRFAWHHPGPLYYYLLAIPNSLFGGRTIGLVLGVTAINLGAAVGVVIVAVRRGGRALGVWTALLLGVYVAALGRFAFDQWNPSATVLPFALVLALSWSVACRDVWAIPWLALAGTFCIQTHVSLTPGVLAAWAAGAAVVVVRARRGRRRPGSRERRALRRSLLTAAVLLVVLWLPPIIEQLTSAHGNLQLLVDFLTTSGSQRSLWDGLRQAAFQSTLLPRDLLQNGHVTDLQSQTAYGLELGVSCVAFAVAMLLAVKARASTTLILLGLVLVELGVAVYSVTRIVGTVDYYLVEWISAIGLMLWIAVGGSILPGMQRWLRMPHGIAWPRVVTFGLLCVVSVVALQGAVRATASRPKHSASDLHTIVSSIVSVPRRSAHVVLELRDTTAYPIFAGTALELEKRGLDVEVIRSTVTELLFEPSYVASRSTGGTRLVFLDATRHDPGSLGGVVVVRAGRWAVVKMATTSGAHHNRGSTGANRP